MIVVGTEAEIAVEIVGGIVGRHGRVGAVVVEVEIADVAVTEGRGGIEV